jgi:hypothetical protein
MVPFTKHFCTFVWQNTLGKHGSFNFFLCIDSMSKFSIKMTILVTFTQKKSTSVYSFPQNPTCIYALAGVLVMLA